MNIRLYGKTVLVTGASRGIGRAMALAFAQAGAQVALLARNRAALEAVQAEIGAAGGHAIVVVADVLDLSAMAGAIATTTIELGPVDILVNNAGVAKSVKFGAMDERFWSEVMRINLDSVMLLTQLVIDDMAKRGFGRIINVASIAAKAGLRYSAAYNASKHGLLGLTRSLALDYAKNGVTVNAICPGWVRTEMLEQAIENIITKTGRSQQEAQDSLLKDVPQGRPVEAEEVAALAVFLASDYARAITGQGLNIDGGSVMS
jgi:NAD(P)-dependent dehydrogenase (short-subunit alcohol dehydrogenase family)